MTAKISPSSTMMNAKQTGIMMAINSKITLADSSQCENPILLNTYFAVALTQSSNFLKITVRVPDCYPVI